MMPTDNPAARSLSSKRPARTAGANLSTTALIESQLVTGPEPVLGVYLHVAYMTFMSTYEEAVGRGEITPNMIGVLSLVAQRSGMSQAELARLFGVERATMGTIVARAMEAGFVIRKDSNGDARRYSLYLTSRGEQMLVKLRQRIPEHEKQAAGRLTLSERQQLRALLDKLVYG
jgi:DNA-binding MarR family transcriptional regulator